MLRLTSCTILAALSLSLSSCGNKDSEEKKNAATGDKYTGDPATSPVPSDFKSTVSAADMPAQFASVATDSKSLADSFDFSGTATNLSGSPFDMDPSETSVSIKEGTGCGDALDSLGANVSTQVESFVGHLTELKAESLPEGVTKVEPTDSRAVVAYSVTKNQEEFAKMGIKSIRLEAGANDTAVIVIWKAEPADCSATSPICMKSFSQEFFFTKATKKLASRSTMAMTMGTEGNTFTMSSNMGTVFEGGDLPKLTTQADNAVSGSVQGKSFNLSMGGTAEIAKTDAKTYTMTASREVTGTGPTGQAVNQKQAFSLTLTKEEGQCKVTTVAAR